MNRYVADPGWHGYIVWYFFLGGIAAGSYAVASLAALFGTEEDRLATRAAHYLAFPLVGICGILLVVDLGRPERFYHMILQSDTWRPMFKGWSPMSAGSWGLSAFGGFSFASFLGVLAEDRRLGLGRWSGLAAKLGRGRLAKAFRAGGALSGFFLGSYTGSLLTASNQPVWADTTWLAALFVAGACSTGIAAVLLIGPRLGDPPAAESVHRLERLDRFAILLELAMIAAVMISLARWWGGIFLRWPGVLVPAFVVPAGLVLPLVLSRSGGRRAEVAAVLVLIGGFALRASIVGSPEPWLLASHRAEAEAR